MSSNVNLLLCRHCYAYCDQTAEVRIMRFGCNVALYFNYLRIKFDDESKRKSLEFQA